MTRHGLEAIDPTEPMPVELSWPVPVAASQVYRAAKRVSCRRTRSMLRPQTSRSPWASAIIPVIQSGAETGEISKTP